MRGCAGKVVNMEQEAGKSFSYEELKTALETHKPAVLFLCQVHLRSAMWHCIFRKQAQPGSAPRCLGHAMLLAGVVQLLMQRTSLGH